MEMIIVSDSHRNLNGLYFITERHPDADHYLHCGDSEFPLDDWERFSVVRGNSDGPFCDYEDDVHLALPTGDHVWITHGHLYATRLNLKRIIGEAKTFDPVPTIVCHGHTHRVDVRQKGGMLLINPGSVQSPRDGRIKTYVRLVITPETYDVQVLSVIDGKTLKAYQFPR